MHLGVWMAFGLHNLKGSQCIRIDEHLIREGEHFNGAYSKYAHSSAIIWQEFDLSSSGYMAQYCPCTTHLDVWLTPIKPGAVLSPEGLTVK